jgi:hypothetical protein
MYKDNRDRPGMVLTLAAQIDRDEFEEQYGTGNCSCFLNAPCASCLHPGNPNNQYEDDDCWKKEE